MPKITQLDLKLIGFLTNVSKTNFCVLTYNPKLTTVFIGFNNRGLR